MPLAPRRQRDGPWPALEDRSMPDSSRIRGDIPARVTALQHLRYLHRELRSTEQRQSLAATSSHIDPDPCPAVRPHGVFANTSFSDSPTAAQRPAHDPFEAAENEREAGLTSVSPRVLQPCSFLQTGQEFTGRQRVSRVTSNRSEDWSVHVQIQGCDLSTGYVCGSMSAENVPQVRQPVVTFWEGEIIDNVNHCFVTGKWDTSRLTDHQHWRQFETAFIPLRNSVEWRCGGRCSKLAEHPYIFMRWKEQEFVDAKEDCGLTITGFYYICLSRLDGTVQGLYCDPTSSPYQLLELRPANSHQGHTVGSYQFC